MPAQPGIYMKMIFGKVLIAVGLWALAAIIWVGRTEPVYTDQWYYPWHSWRAGTNLAGRYW